jgi:hypothetical protein
MRSWCPFNFRLFELDHFEKFLPNQPVFLARYHFEWLSILAAFLIFDTPLCKPKFHSRIPCFLQALYFVSSFRFRCLSNVYPI